MHNTLQHTWRVPLSHPQKSVLLSLIRDSEEARWYKDRMKRVDAIFLETPKIYTQSGKKFDSVAYLHYFRGGCDAYVTEVDRGDEELPAFGLICRAGDASEFGYLSLKELVKNGFELDLHFDPQSIREVLTVGADAVVAPLPLESAWPPEMDVHQAVQSLMTMLHTQGKTVAGDLHEALFNKLEAAVIEGEELSDTQQAFYDEELRMRERSPLYQKPKPC